MTLEEAKKLSPKELNRVIAEALGWKPRTHGVLIRWTDPFPDYFHDLNACAEVIQRLPEQEKGNYHSEMFIHFNGGPSLHPRIHWSTLVDTPANIRAIAIAVVLSERKK